MVYRSFILKKTVFADHVYMLLVTKSLSRSQFEIDLLKPISVGHSLFISAKPGSFVH